MTDIDSINHVGIAVRDLAATASRYEAMGFMLTPYSPHAGAWKPGEAPQPFGSGNRCVMFAHDYLEILGNENPARPSPRISNLLAHHQGAHIVCFNSDDVAAVDRRLQSAGITTSGVIPLQREVDTPDGIKTARFERVQFAPSDSPEGYVQAARHLTPDCIYQPRYTAHANGCTGLANVFIVTDDVDHFSSKYAVYTGLTPQTHAASAVFQLPQGAKLHLLRPRDAVEQLPGTLHPPLPGILAVAFVCPALQAQATRLADAGIACVRAAGRLIVPAEEASGVAIVFEAAQ